MSEYMYLLLFLLLVAGFTATVGCIALHIIIAAEDRKRKQQRHDTRKR